MNTLEKILYPTIDSTKDLFRAGVTIAKTPEAQLYGPGSSLDSLELVNFIVAVEEKIEEVSGKTVRLVNEKAMSRKSSPFKTVGTLAEFIDELLQ